MGRAFFPSLATTTQITNMININPFYSIKMTFAAILILSALTLEAQCQNSISERFNSFILAITSANGDDKQSIVSDQQFVAERPVELELTKARQLQEWIGQVADKFVDEHAIETANYNCKPNIKINDVILDDVILTKFEKKLFLKLLFSFGASLSAEIGGPLHQHENNYLRSLLTAYGCVEGQLVAEEKNSDFNFGIRDYKNIKESMYTFDIESVMKNPISGLVTQKVILKMPSAAAEHNNNHQARHIQSFSLLNALNVQLSALDVIQFAQFAAKFQYNALQTNFLNVDKADKETIGQHTAKYALIAHQLILHIKNLTKLEILKKQKNDGLQERLKTADKGSQKTEIFAHYDSAIRIDWNVWKEVKQYVDELIDEAAKMHKDKELSTFFKNGANNKKFELVLTYEQKQTFKLQEYREFLNTIQRECNEKIKQYEIELPYKINQIETYLKFNEFIAATVQKFGKKLIKKKGEDEKVVCDLDGANKLLDELYEFAIKKIALTYGKNSDGTFGNNGEKDNNLLSSFATRLGALAYGKNSDGTFGKNGKKDKIQAFLAVSKCFISHHEWANKSIFDLWMEIKMVNFEKIKKPVAGIEIYKNINDKERQISQDNYNVLKQMNERKFSIYETTNILLKIANLIGLFGRICAHK
uniref:Uncharacterized protein n=1 Tax=Globodera rostochiensis TaxID=31243 RepID=A0A914HM43_GLORO